MGHKSHNRASKGGTPEVLSNHVKDKHDTHECGSRAGGRSRREKRSHKRKREHNDNTKRRHKERHRGSHCSSRSSSKGKPREKVHRLKDDESPESDSSREDDESSRGCQRGSSSRHCGGDEHHKRARSLSTAPYKEYHKEHRSKRVKSNKENFSLDHSRENCDALIEPSRTEEVVHKRIDLELGKVGQYVGTVSSSKLTRSERERTLVEGQEQERGLEGRKDTVLEVELRQKALANFMRHQDVSWRSDPHDPMSDGDSGRPTDYNERDVRVVGEADKRCLLAVGNAFDADAPKNTSDTVAPIDVKCPAEENDNNLEEGEIKSDTETEHDNSSSVVEKGKVLQENVEQNLHAIREDYEKQDDSRINEREIERGVRMAAPCVNVKQELSQELVVKGSPGVDSASAQRDSGNNFQEKTMSVMRGGELVQVSYKVYIPKRAAELARRRLQR